MIRLGPAGWDYADWQGVVYPPGLKGADRLTFLSALFGVVEVNVTFYRPIGPHLARRWLEAVAQAADFRFTAKLWGRFTHERQWSAPELTQFKEGLAPLLAAGRLGALLAQFPYSFHNTGENRAYLLELQSVLPEFPLTVEVRHRYWQSRQVRDFLTNAGLDFCNIDQHQVYYSLGKTAWVNGPRGYLRCHGRRKEAWFEFGEDRQARYDYLYTPAELEELAARTRELMAQSKEVYVIFNNHPAGQAAANALELTRMLFPERHASLPSCLLAAFPRLSEAVMGGND